ncbi:RNA polymerase sigma factor [Flavobacterium branchiophilum]|uniref:RNA polymerase subunit sigma-24 n=1 Tax=Flavobacterium branchiophilum TaxID=55197 RepID=A0A2H3KFI0_9FLAO|nr:sigma-70 family RNA polymerase sigma factor [Flavobacterium branchiophilum]PDS26127.1 RNA polymerase subunit sigma-24 [Flavobacterium branchiophilum]
MAVSETLLLNCKKKQRAAQRQLYEYMSPKLYATCKRYLKKEEEVEEALGDAFYQIFTKLDQLKEWGAFEAWARRITVNCCLASIKKNTNFNMYLEDAQANWQPKADEQTPLEEADLLALVQKIPDGCRTIFNLFVMEGFGHKEIAAMLQISEGTSKSQLNVAKTKLKDLVNTFYYQKAK